MALCHFVSEIHKMAMCHFVISQVFKIDNFAFLWFHKMALVPFCEITNQMAFKIDFCDFTKWHSAILWNHKMAMCHFVISQVFKIDFVISQNGYTLCHFVKSQNGNVPFCDFTSFQNWQFWIFVISQNGTVPFCEITKWHPAILWNHKNAKSIVICLNLKITKEGGNSPPIFSGNLFWKLSSTTDQAWISVGWPPGPGENQANSHRFFNMLESSFFGASI